jgi:superfamily II DNA or RNA helicase
VAREYLVMPLTRDIGLKERTSALERFRCGVLRALVSARVLNEGVDVPDAEVGIVVAGRLGEWEHVQRVGRILRPGEGKRALVYELVVRATAEVGQSARGVRFSQARGFAIGPHSKLHPLHRRGTPLLRGGPPTERPGDSLSATGRGLGGARAH